MEGTDPDNGKRKLEEEIDGQSQIEKDKKQKVEEETIGQSQIEKDEKQKVEEEILEQTQFEKDRDHKLEEETFVPSQNEKGKQKMEEETDGKWQTENDKENLEEETNGKSLNENGNEKLEEETEGKSPKPKSIQCYFCSEMLSSPELYIMHMELYHPNFINRKKTRKRSVYGQIVVVDYISCYLCPDELSSKEGFLRHLNEDHRSKSWAETIKRFGNAESDAELFGRIASQNEDNQDIEGLSDLPLNADDWEAFIKELPSSQDQEKTVAGNVDDPEKSIVDKVDDHAAVAI